MNRNRQPSFDPQLGLNNINENYDRELVLELLEKYIKGTSPFGYGRSYTNMAWLVYTLGTIMGERGVNYPPLNEPRQLHINEMSRFGVWVTQVFQQTHRIWNYIANRVNQ